MMPEPLPPYAALARTRAAFYQPDARATGAAESPPCFADEMAEPAKIPSDDDAEEDRDDIQDEGRAERSPPEPAAPFGRAAAEVATSAADCAYQAAVPGAAGGGGGQALLSPAASATGGTGLIEEGTSQTPAGAGLSDAGMAHPASVPRSGAAGARAVNDGPVASGDGDTPATAGSAATEAPTAATPEGAGRSPTVAAVRPATGDAGTNGIAPAFADPGTRSVTPAGDTGRAAPAGETAGEKLSGASGSDDRDSAGATGPAPSDPRMVPAGGAEAGGSGAGSDGGGFADRAGADASGLSPAAGADRAAATPAEASRTADHRPAAPQAIGSQIADGIRQARDGSIEISLSPEELGSLHMTISGDDLNLQVRIHADRPETEGLLRRHIALLQQDFRDLGYGQVAFDFGPRQDQPARFGMGSLDQEIPGIGAEAVSAPAEPPLRLTGTPVPGRGLDIRL